MLCTGSPGCDLALEQHYCWPLCVACVRWIIHGVVEPCIGIFQLFDFSSLAHFRGIEFVLNPLHNYSNAISLSLLTVSESPMLLT